MLERKYDVLIDLLCADNEFRIEFSVNIMLFVGNSVVPLQNKCHD